MPIDYVRPEACIPEILQDAEFLTSFRRNIHSEPELGFETKNTAEKIASVLREAGIEEIDTETLPGAVFALIKGTSEGPTVALRADIDALGMPDKTGSEWASKICDRAHACGHDGHQTWLLGAARYLAKHNDFAGNVLLIFQSAEEIAKGADAVVATGVLERFKAKEIYGMHTEPNLDAGHFGFRPGPLQASSDCFYITVKGKGGHGGRPHLANDPIPVGAELILSLQNIVARRVNPMNNAVVSICSVNAGKFETANVIPSEVTISGTVRTFSPDDRVMIEEEINRRAKAMEIAAGVKIEVKYENLCATVMNDAALTQEAVRTASELIGEENVHPNIDAFMSSEDFSAYQQRVPGIMVRCGIRDENHHTPLHNPAMDFNDRVLPLASTFLVKVVQNRLNALNK